MAFSTQIAFYTNNNPINGTPVVLLDNSSNVIFYESSETPADGTVPHKFTSATKHSRDSERVKTAIVKLLLCGAGSLSCR